MSNRDLFIQWFAWGVREGDCDPALWMLNYLHRRYEHNVEERAWTAWLYGTTYQLPTAWVLKQEFPDVELAAASRAEAWNSANYKRLRYQTDTKWNKGHFPTMLASYREWLGGRRQIDALTVNPSWSPRQRFEYLWRHIRKRWFKFGRYSTWFYLQTLAHTAGVPLEPSSLMLDDWSGSRSHRNGLLLALGQPQKLDQRLSKHDLGYLEGFAVDMLEEARLRFPEEAAQLDLFSMETALCSFKKLWRRRDGRYPGYYLDRQVTEIERAASDDWHGVDWSVLHQARSETLDHRLLAERVDKAAMGEFLDTGSLHRLGPEWLRESRRGA
jgi:hypothetical protein